MSSSLEITRGMLQSVVKAPVSVFDEVAGKGETVLITGTFTQHEEMPELPGGWRLNLQVRAPKGVSKDDKTAECPGKVILFYGDSRTRKIWIRGQVAYAMREGLSEEHAQNWVNSKVSYKHDNIRIVVKILKNEAQTKAWLEWPGSKAEEEQIQAWSVQYNIRDNLYPVRRDQVQLLLKDILGLGATPKKTHVPNHAFASAFNEAMARHTQAEREHHAAAQEHDEEVHDLEESADEQSVQSDTLNEEVVPETPAS